MQEPGVSKLVSVRFGATAWWTGRCPIRVALPTVSARSSSNYPIGEL